MQSQFVVAISIVRFFMLLEPARIRVNKTTILSCNKNRGQRINCVRSVAKIIILKFLIDTTKSEEILLYTPSEKM